MLFWLIVVTMEVTTFPISKPFRYIPLCYQHNNINAMYSIAIERPETPLQSLDAVHGGIIAATVARAVNGLDGAVIMIWYRIWQGTIKAWYLLPCLHCMLFVVIVIRWINWTRPVLLFRCNVLMYLSIDRPDRVLYPIRGIAEPDSAVHVVDHIRRQRDL